MASAQPARRHPIPIRTTMVPPSAPPGGKGVKLCNAIALCRARIVRGPHSKCPAGHRDVSRYRNSPARRSASASRRPPRGRRRRSVSERANRQQKQQQQYGEEEEEGENDAAEGLYRSRRSLGATGLQRRAPSPRHRVRKTTTTPGCSRCSYFRGLFVLCRTGWAGLWAQWRGRNRRYGLVVRPEGLRACALWCSSARQHAGQGNELLMNAIRVSLAHTRLHHCTRPGNTPPRCTLLRSWTACIPALLTESKD